MKFFLSCLLAILLSAGTASFAQSDREIVLRRVVDGLNSADSVKRMITLEEAMATKDPIIRSIAVKTAMASSDITLRSMVLGEVLKTKSTLLMKVTGFADDGNNDHRHIVDKTSGTIDLVIQSFEPVSGDFEIYSSISSTYQNAQGKWVPRPLPANFSGDRLSFTLNVGKLQGTGSMQTCRGTLYLKEGTSRLDGKMNCDRYGNYDIEIDLLR